MLIVFKKATSDQDETSPVLAALTPSVRKLTRGAREGAFPARLPPLPRLPLPLVGAGVGKVRTRITWRLLWVRHSPVLSPRPLLRLWGRNDKWWHVHEGTEIR